MKSTYGVKVFIEELLKGDFETIEIMLKELYLSHISYYEKKFLGKFKEIEEEEQDNIYESFYHGFILELLIYANRYYDIHSNREYGSSGLFHNEISTNLISVISNRCRPDIVLIAKDKKKSAYIFEFKWASTQSKKTLESLIKLASDQIKEKKYVEGVRSRYDIAKITTVAVGFRGKEIEIKIKE